MRILLFLAAIVLTSCSGTPPKLGVVDGKLTPCDSSGHCATATLTYSDALPEAKARLHKAIEDYGRAKFVQETENYWRVDFTSFLFRFVDDVEFLFRAPGQIDVRSGSRLGSSDFGVNEKRIRTIREQFQK